jgi:SAM-dependent methyltransferase
MEAASSEAAAEEALRAFLRGQRAPDDYIEAQVFHLFNEASFRDRFAYLCEHIDEGAKAHLFVSGAAIGTELKVGYDLGFARVTGAEYYGAHVEIAQRRFADRPQLQTVQFDGLALPFPDATFTCSSSGHVIEHTKDPRAYLDEHMRILKPGGFMFIEFPTRFHHIELHTRMPSVEWLPQAVRTRALKFLMSDRSPLSAKNRFHYREILETLQPVSLPQIRWWLRKRARVIHATKPDSGIVRAIIQKLPLQQL